MLQKISEENFELILLVTKDSPFLKWDLPPHVSLYLMKTTWISFWGQFEILYVLQKIKPELFHSPSFFVPLFSHIPMICTIHDLNHVALSQHYSWLHKVYYKFFLFKKLHKAKFILTVSKFSKDQIATFFKINPDHIHVVYNGLSEDFKPLQSKDKIKAERFRLKYELPESFVLSIGNPKPHKNLDRLITAYCQGNFDVPLVLLTAFDTKLLNIAKGYQKKHQIHFLRFVPNELMPYLYSLSRLFIYPSWYEGFGLPPLEAAACGVPIVISHTSSLPEILGYPALSDNGSEGADDFPRIFIDPHSTEDMIRGLQQGLQMTEQTSSALSPQSFAVQQHFLKRFSWPQAAEQTFSYYKKALGTQAVL